MKDYDVEKVAQKSGESQVDGGQGNLPGTRKIYEFYNAPIVKFWFHTVGPHLACQNLPLILQIPLYAAFTLPNMNVQLLSGGGGWVDMRIFLSQLSEKFSC